MIARAWLVNRRLRLVAIGALGVGAAALIGRVLAAGTQASFLLAIVLGTGCIIAFRPMFGLCATYTVLLLVPYSLARIDIPVLHSPVQAIATLTFAAAMIRWLLQRYEISRTPLVWAWVACAIVLYLAAFAGHGEAAGNRLSLYLESTWPIPLILLLVRTPRQAKSVFTSMIASGLALAIIWFPGLLTLATTQGGRLMDFIRQGDQTGLALEGAASIFKVTGAVSIQTVLVPALLSPILLSVALNHRRHRLWILTAWTILILITAASTLASALLCIGVGTVMVLVLFLFPIARTGVTRYRGLILTIPLAGLITAFALNIPTAEVALERLSNPEADASGSVRLASLITSWRVFGDHPLIGVGPYDRGVTLPDGRQLVGHNTFGTMAYEYGLVLLIPFGVLLFVVARTYIRLLRQPANSTLETGALMGALASLIAAIATGFATPTLLQVTPDIVIWTMATLAAIWSDWRRGNPTARLLAEPARQRTRHPAVVR